MSPFTNGRSYHSSLPSLDSVAPAFEAETAFGPLRLEDFKGICDHCERQSS
jgi:hypothetical protein